MCIRDSPKTNSKYDDGLIGWRKLPIRSQDSLYQWEYDDEDNLIGMTQMPPPNFGLYTIPLEKAIHFRTRSRKGNPEGRSILRNAYRSWYFKKGIQAVSYTHLLIDPRELDQDFRDATLQILDTVLIMSLIVLKDEFDFGTKRLDRFKKRFNDKTECLETGNVTWIDMIEQVREEHNIKLDLRKNDVVMAWRKK